MNEAIKRTSKKYKASRVISYIFLFLGIIASIFTGIPAFAAIGTLAYGSISVLYSLKQLKNIKTLRERESVNNYSISYQKIDFQKREKAKEKEITKEPIQRINNYWQNRESDLAYQNTSIDMQKVKKRRAA